MWARRFALVALFLAGTAEAFVSQSSPRAATSKLRAGESNAADENEPADGSKVFPQRRAFISRLIGSSLVIGGMPSISNAEEEETFESIAARAAQLSSTVGESTPVAVPKSDDPRTAYDFNLPVAGQTVEFKDVVRQTYDEEGRAKVKAFLVVNMKEDDPVARKDIPEFISLAAKYGRDGEFVVILSPSDQGYYEPDTSQLIRLKLASEYGYGINPATVLTDKVNFLGTGAHPFWRWLQKNCRNPQGIGRIEGNFEKFLVDGRTGLPLRRYPRKYKPLDIKNDIEAIIAGRPLPPAGANYNEQWRSSSVEAERDTYRFQKGLNYFDQQAE